MSYNFYEFILVNSDSISIKHYFSKEDSSVVTHSSVQILKVLTTTAWGSDPFQQKKLSQNFDPIGYNYQVTAMQKTCIPFSKSVIQALLAVLFQRGDCLRIPSLVYFMVGKVCAIPNVLPKPVIDGLRIFIQNCTLSITKQNNGTPIYYLSFGI